jgi:hypothetical protein
VGVFKAVVRDQHWYEHWAALKRLQEYWSTAITEVVNRKPSSKDIEAILKWEDEMKPLRAKIVEVGDRMYALLAKSYVKIN